MPKQYSQQMNLKSCSGSHHLSGRKKKKKRLQILQGGTQSDHPPHFSSHISLHSVVYSTIIQPNNFVQSPGCTSSLPMLLPLPEIQYQWSLNNSCSFSALRTQLRFLSSRKSFWRSPFPPPPKALKPL